MSTMSSWGVLAIVCAVLLGGCPAIAGGVDHWPGSLPAVALMVTGRVINDQVKLLKWPMEFAFWSALLLIFCNPVYLCFKPI